MAVTSIWRIKGSVDKVILYAENPDKTVKKELVKTDDENKSSAGILNSVIQYTERSSATETMKFVSGVNCSPNNAAFEMTQVKKRFGKTDGTEAYHGYQSFAKDEVTPETAHYIGVELANRLWGDKYQVVVATHIDKQSHIHTHFVLNTVSFVDGRKYHRTKQDYELMRKVSDDLCKEYGLSVIQNPPRASRKYYVEYMAEKNGDFTKNGIIKRDIDECVVATLTEQQFYREMAKRGYTFDFSHKYATISHPNFPKARRLKTLGEDYTPEAISERIYGHWKRERIEYPEQDDSENLFFGGDRNNPHIFDNYQTVYFHFIFGVGVIKERGDYNRELQRLLGEDLIKFDKRVEEQNLLLDNDLYTDEDILNFKTECQNEINELTEARKKLRNQLKCAVRADDISEQKEIKADISVLSQRIKKLRKNISVCDRLTENEPRIENNLYTIREIADRQKGKEREDDECIKRRSRPNREDYS